MVPRRTFAGTLLAIAVAATSSSLSTRAAKPIELPLTWSETFGEYLVNISIGTPPQRLALVYDSGSSDIWVSGRDTALCGTGACEIFGAFRPENSSTVNRTSLRLIEEYGSGGLVRGVFLQDTLEIAGVKIPNFAFGYATTVPADNPPILGMGLNSLQALANLVGPQDEVPNILDAMIKAAVIERRAFGLYLDDEEAGKGSVTLGGIDSSKYQGELTTFPMAKNQSGTYDRYRLDLTSVTFTDDTGKTTSLLSNSSTPVVLDSGSTALLIPGDVTTDLIKGLGAPYSDDLQSNLVDCTMRNNNASLNFQLGNEGPMYAVPLSALIDSEPLSIFEDGAEACLLLLEPANSSDSESPLLGGYTLGAPFLRNLYVIYDLENHLISLAPAVFNQTSSSSSNLHLIPSGTALSQASTTVFGQPTALSIPYSLTTTNAAATATTLGGAAGSATSAATVGVTIPSVLSLSQATPTFAVSTGGAASNSINPSWSELGTLVIGFVGTMIGLRIV